MDTSKEKYVFLHIGKTAGTSVRDAISSQFRKDEVCRLPFSQQIRDLPEAERQRYRLFCAHVGYQQATELGNRIFTVLRDPVDRVLSLYYYWQEVDGDFGGPALTKGMNLEEFLESKTGAVVQDVYNTQTWQLAFAHDGKTRKAISQTHSPDQIYKQAIVNLEKLDVVGVQELLGSFMTKLDNVYGWTLPALGKTNVTASRARREEIPIKIRKRIQQKVCMDIELYSHVLQKYVNSG